MGTAPIFRYGPIYTVNDILNQKCRCKVKNRQIGLQKWRGASFHRLRPICRQSGVCGLCSQTIVSFLPRKRSILLRKRKFRHPNRREEVWFFSIFALTRLKRIRCENSKVQVVLSITKPRFPRNVRALAEAAMKICTSIEFCQDQITSIKSLLFQRERGLQSE